MHGKNLSGLYWMSEKHCILLVITFYCKGYLNLQFEASLRVCLKVIYLETK